MLLTFFVVLEPVETQPRTQAGVPKDSYASQLEFVS